MIFRNLLIATAMVAPSLASADPIKYEAVLSAQLEPMTAIRYVEANLSMDGRKGLLELTVQPKMPVCAEGSMCIQLMPEPQTYTLDGASSTVDHCGIITTQASRDDRPVDGTFRQITVRHNQNNTCPTFRPIRAIEVELEVAYYDRINGGEVSQQDSFETDNVIFIKPSSKGNDVEFNGQIGSALYNKKALSLELTYTGGCKTHDFDLKWGECKKVRVMNSLIDQCEVTVLHTQGSDDLCKATITKKHKFDLSGLGQAYIIKIGEKKILVH